MRKLPVNATCLSALFERALDIGMHDHSIKQIVLSVGGDSLIVYVQIWNQLPSDVGKCETAASRG